VAALHQRPACETGVPSSKWHFGRKSVVHSAENRWHIVAENTWRILAENEETAQLTFIIDK